jgi:phenylacetate-coenzyme A ligase PaaK-like adenylate-forming protein
MSCEWNDKIFNIKKGDFLQLALEIFRYQYSKNPVYKSYVDALNILADEVREFREIPFLPIGFFKTHRVATTEFAPQAIFESSGTTQMINSRHFVKDLSLYEESFLSCFQNFYGEIKDFCVIGLLPSYLERKNSSLVYMVNKLIQLSDHPKSGFYLDEWERLRDTLAGLERKRQKTLLIGVTFALLDFAEKFSMPLRSTIIMETGGMKGRREEMIREEVHTRLKTAFQTENIHSEYGMTELLSQAYSSANGLFHCPSWMKVLIRNEEDPFDIKEKGSGAINIIDLANIYSCSFIATDDAGTVFEDGSFEILGRMDNTDLRGCSLLVV